MSTSPLKESVIPKLPPPTPASLLDPPSPRTHRALRRLQSAHSLGQSNSQPSLISQQHKQAIQANQTTSDNSSIPQHSRGRSNSDATNMMPPNLGAAGRRPITSRRPVAADALSLDRLIRDGPPDGDLVGALESVRLKVLGQGIKSDTDGMSSLRIYVWLILLNGPVLNTDDYLSLIHRGASPAYSKIRNDTFRTLKKDPLFKRRVSEASIIRLLNAVAWKLHDAKEERAENLRQLTGGNISEASSPELSTPSRSRNRALTLTTEGSDAGGSEPSIYVQGMNVIAAPFLYAARSETEAFAAFYRLITNECPGYVRSAMDGVHKGLALVDKVLAIVDPKLSMYLIGKGMSAKIYAFASVTTLCACTPPLPQVLRVWDFLFAYGVHLNLLCIVAQLVILRNSILSSPSPTKILRQFPPITAETVIEVTLSIVKKIPDDVFAEIVTHAK